MRLLRNVRVDESDFLGSEILLDVSGDEGKRLGGSVAAEADVEHVFFAGGESDDVQNVDPVTYESPFTS